MKVEKNDHFTVARLKDGVTNVVVQYVHLVASDRRVTEAVGVRLQGAHDSLLRHVGPNVEVL